MPLLAERWSLLAERWSLFTERRTVMFECCDLQGLLAILSPLLNPLNWLYGVLDVWWNQIWCLMIPGLDGCA